MRKIKGQSPSSGAEPVIHNRLPVLRAERGLSRQQLAEALGINYQTVGYLERGEYNPSLELAFRISEFFALPFKAVFARQPFRPLSEKLYARIENSGGLVGQRMIHIIGPGPGRDHDVR